MPTSKQKSKPTKTSGKSTGAAARSAKGKKSTQPKRSDPTKFISPKPSPAKPSSTSKKETVLGMLRQPKGTTVAAITKATGWQPHSVRGFLVGVVKNKLKLKLGSERVGEQRVYSVSKAGAGS